MAKKEQLADAIELLVVSAGKVSAGLVEYLRRNGIEVDHCRNGSIVDKVGRDFVGGCAAVSGLISGLKKYPAARRMAMLSPEDVAIVKQATARNN